MQVSPTNRHSARARITPMRIMSVLCISVVLVAVVEAADDCYDLKSVTSFTDQDLLGTLECTLCYKNCAGAWTRAFDGNKYKKPVVYGTPTTIQCEEVPASWDAILKRCTCHTGTGGTVTVTVTNAGPGASC